ncbi:uncharacterized protein [Antedon mediterranea]|uniref:uncharacterized protein isoform X1 n=1 Tax=Antedon mediterranea TaxID=105859 RepID=UPI003AF6029B
MGDIEDTFTDFRQAFSNAYLGNGYLKLRFLLQDHLPISVLSSKYNTGMNLFNSLKDRGDISYTDVNIMSEIAKVTKNATAKSCVKAFIEDVGLRYDASEGITLSSYRKTLYNAMDEITEVECGDVHNLTAYYGLGHLGFQNKWDVVFHLEKEVKLNDTRVKWKRFADQLNTKAQIILLEYNPSGADDTEGAPSISTGAQATTSTDGGICRQSSTQNSDLTAQELMEIAKKLGFDWEELAIAGLGFKKPDIDRLKMDNRNSIIGAIFGMLDAWSKKVSVAEHTRRSQLVNALKKIERNDLAEEVEINNIL